MYGSNIKNCCRWQSMWHLIGSLSLTFPIKMTLDMLLQPKFPMTDLRRWNYETRWLKWKQNKEPWARCVCTSVCVCVRILDDLLGDKYWAIKSPCILLYHTHTHTHTHTPTIALWCTYPNTHAHTHTHVILFIEPKYIRRAAQCLWQMMHFFPFPSRLERFNFLKISLISASLCLKKSLFLSI